MISRLRASVLVFGLGLGLGADLRGPAQAAESAPMTSKREQARIARQQNALGLKLYREGDYQGAINAFWAAYQIKQAPQLLFNIAQAHRKDGNLEQARDIYERFLKDAAASPLHVEAETYLAEVRAELDRRAHEAELLAAQQKAQEERLRQLPAAVVVVAPPPPRPFYKKAWFYGVIGGVAAATALGVGLGIGLRPSDPHTDLGFHPVGF